jgi:predicted nucleic acid-binding protein
MLGTGANLVTDAQLAAFALEYNAVLATGDRDFQRFPGLKLSLLF